MKKLEENTDKEQSAQIGDKEQNIEERQEEKASGEKDLISPQKDKKFYLTKTSRIALYVIGVVILLASITTLFIKSRPYEKTEDVKVNSYSITTDASYKVHLLENTVFEDEFLEEGQLYPTALADSILIDFKSEVGLIKDVSLSGNYSVSAVIEGYDSSSADERINIYKKTYPLAEGNIEEQTAHNATMTESLSIEPSVYKTYSTEIESALGGETAKDCYILFEGKYNINNEEKPFSYKVYIPVGKEKFYSVKKDETVVDSADITESEAERVNPKFGSYGIYIILCILAVGLLAFVKLFTKNMEGEGLKLKRLSRVMRKYGSRMVCVEEVPLSQEKAVLKLKNIIDLVSLSDEIREPVIYSMDENELPKDGRLYILSKEYVYFVDVNVEN